MNLLLQENNDWRMITSVLTDVLDAQFGVTVLRNFSGCHVKPVIENLSAEQYRLVIPIGEEAGKPVVAVGTLDAGPGEILEKLLGLTLRYVQQGRRLEEQRLDLDAYAEQISRDFEELTWLRSLLQHLKDGDGTGSAENGSAENGSAENIAENIAETILLRLCPLIRAEQIILISADPQSTSPDHEVPPVGKVVARAGPGKQIVDDQGCCRMVDRLREVAGGQPFVQTGMKRRREFSMVPGADSCLLVPAIRRGFLVGWLLAVNRVPRTVAPETTPGNTAAELAEDEFGTFEANLLDCAGVILASHAGCAELFGQGAAAEKECPAPN
jgi:hypothetical protein